MRDCDTVRIFLFESLALLIRRCRYHNDERRQHLMVDFRVIHFYIKGYGVLVQACSNEKGSIHNSYARDMDMSRGGFQMEVLPFAKRAASWIGKH